MKRFLNFLKGVAVGVANIIPGLSGGTLAVILKIYEDVLDGFANIFKHPILVIKKYYLLYIGIIVGVLAGLLVVSSMYDLAPLPTSFFFCGFVIATVPFLFKSIDFKKVNFFHILWFIIGAVAILLMPFLTGSEKNIELNVFNVFLLGFLGFFAAAIMILPGASGSMFLAATGYYKPIINILRSILNDMKDLNFTEAFYGNLLLIVVFAIGCVLGIVAISKALKFLLKKYFTATYSFTLGLVSASAVAIIIVALKEDNYFNDINDLWMWIFGIIALGVGIYLGLLMVKKENKDIKRKKSINNKIEEIKNEALDDFIKLLKIPSVLTDFNPSSSNPFGDELKNALDFVCNMAISDEFIVKNIDNYATHIEFGNPNGELVGILAHLDVVPAIEEEWSHNPYDPVIINGKIFARGVADDKGPLIASYYALKIIKELRLPVKKRVRLIIGCDEESGSRCLNHYFKTEEMPSLGFSPDACFPLINGEKAMISFDITGKLTDEIVSSFICGERYNIVPGIAKMTLTKNYEKEYLKFLEDNNYEGYVKDGYYIAKGKSCHAMNPEEGLNAGFILIKFLNEYHKSTFSTYMTNYLTFDPTGEKLGINISNNELGSLTSNVGIINVNNNEFKIGIDLRVPQDNYKDTLLEKINKSFLDYPNFKSEILTNIESHYVSKDSFLVKTLMNVYKEFSKDNTGEPYVIGGGTYAKFIKNAVAFGPAFVGREDVCHIKDEYLYLDDFNKLLQIYTNAIYELIK